jgi:deazaflavin-dependent oxidoreductase (nitroreductase family)
MVLAAFFSCLAVPVVLIVLVRFFKRPLAAFHRVVTNRLARKFAARLPGFALVENVGRRSGRTYMTPVNVFRQTDGFLIALTYGRECGWVANVMAAGSCKLQTRGTSYQLVAPALVCDPSRRKFPVAVRVVLGLIEAQDYLHLKFRDHRTPIGAMPPNRL